MNPRESKKKLEGFRVLTEYECGRAQMAIEWVARAQKPIVEIGGCPIEGCDFRLLARDLNRCISQSGEAVRAFVIPDRIPEYCCYGFYRHPWAIRALLTIWAADQWPADLSCWFWLEGLLFGYSPDAIQRFTLSALCERESSQPWPSCNQVFRLGRVEMYGILAQIVRQHNS